MRMALSTAFALAMITTAAAAAEPLPADLIRSPDWASTPTGKDLLRAYPKKAFRDRVEGNATVECSVLPNGGLDACDIIRPIPDPEGFGQAAKDLASRRFRVKPVDKDGQPTAGRRVRVTLSWTLPPEVGG